MKHKIYTGIAVLAVVILISGASLIATASPGTTSDPLVSRGYLEGPFRTAMNNHVTNHANSLTNTFNSRIANAETSFRNTMAAHRTQTFASVSRSNTQTVTLQAGSEVMLRGGSASTSGSPLVNQTTGAEQASGGLALNNMYVATGNTTITATANGTLLLVRGN